MPANKQANRLIHEKSPYLLQHAYNPVDWFPWSDEAFEKAKAEDKPIFLSIGYSTCHWCHVMERESFEDDEVAEILNKHFVSIKVDREERPDIDNIYMSACQALTGHGGWPLTIFMTPEKKPFYAGTYFPKNDRMGMPGLISILNRVVKAWQRDRDTLIESSHQITEALGRQDEFSEDELPADTIHEAYSDFKEDFDAEYGGFGRAPKFPTPHNLLFLLRYWHAEKVENALHMVEKTLDSMYRGGIYDHIGFGFCRYSTDRKWLVPHFEKMLYDNALLAMAYLEAYHATGKEQYGSIARQIFEYVLRDMTSPEGGFYSAEDADSEGVEGKFYVWSVEEIEQVLGKNAGEKFCQYFDITPRGNFEGMNIPNLIKGAVPEEDKELMEQCRKKLFEHREKRVRPFRDDKILTGWNGLMIASLAAGGRILNEEKYTKAAEKAANFIFTRLIREDGRLMARYREGQAALPAYVDDYAFMVWGLTELYETTYNPEYLQKAIKLNSDMLGLFWDEEKDGLFLYGSDSEQLILRPKEVYDGAVPSGNSVAALNFLKLARLTGQHELEEKAAQMFKLFGSSVKRAPRAYSFFMTAFLYSQAHTKEIVIVGRSTEKNTESMIKALRNEYRPFTLSLLYTEKEPFLSGLAPFIADYKALEEKTTAYVCRNFTCHAPTNDVEQLKRLLDSPN